MTGDIAGVAMLGANHGVTVIASPLVAGLSKELGDPNAAAPPSGRGEITGRDRGADLTDSKTDTSKHIYAINNIATTFRLNINIAAKEDMSWYANV